MCYRCQNGKDAANESEQRMLLEYGWYAHIVEDDYAENTPTGFNYHTHGLPHSVDHFDLQVVHPFPRTHQPMLNRIVGDFIQTHLKEGEKVAAGQVSAEVLDQLNVAFANARECGRPVLRIILPDPNNGLLPGRIVMPFARQWEDILDLNEWLKGR